MPYCSVAFAISTFMLLYLLLLLAVECTWECFDSPYKPVNQLSCMTVYAIRLGMGAFWMWPTSGLQLLNSFSTLRKQRPRKKKTGRKRITEFRCAQMTFGLIRYGRVLLYYNRSEICIKTCNIQIHPYSRLTTRLVMHQVFASVVVFLFEQHWTKPNDYLVYSGSIWLKSGLIQIRLTFEKKLCMSGSGQIWGSPFWKTSDLRE